MRKKVLTDGQVTNIVSSLSDIAIKADELSNIPNLKQQDKDTLDQMKATVHECISSLSNLPESGSNLWRDLLKGCLKQLTTTLARRAGDIDPTEMMEILKEAFSNL